MPFEDAGEPLFRWAPHSTKTGEGMRRTDVDQMLKAAAVSCGIPAADVSTCSCRRGGATALHQAGASFESLRIFGRWASDVARIYIQDTHAQMRGVAQQMVDSVDVFRARVAPH